jgi:hypothetical protein
VHGSGGQPHLAAQLGDAGAAVGAQQVDQLPVDGVDGALRPGRGGAEEPASCSAPEYPSGRTLAEQARDEGVARVFAVLLVVAVVVVVLVVRATAAAGSELRPPRPARRPRPPRTTRPVAPDDDPEFLRELGRRARRDDGSPA